MINISKIIWESENINKILSDKVIHDSCIHKLIPISQDVYFSQPIWNFAFESKEGSLNKICKFDFRNFSSPELLIFLKKVILRELFVKENRYSSVMRAFCDLRKFVNYLERSNILSVSVLTPKVIEKFIKAQSEKLKKRTLVMLIANIKKYLSEVEFIYPSFRLSKFKELFNVVDQNEINAEIRLGKFPIIPRAFLNKIVQCALNDINDNRINDYITVKEFAEQTSLSKIRIIDRIKTGSYPGTINFIRYKNRNSEYLIPRKYINMNQDINLLKNEEVTYSESFPATVDEKIIAAMILLFSQTGLRRSEFLALEIGKLKKITIQNGTEKAYYLEFLTFKTSLERDGKWTESWMNELAVKAYLKLEELTENRRSGEQKALYPNRKGDFYSASNIIDIQFEKFFKRHQESLGIENLSDENLGNLNKWIITEKDIKYKFKSLSKQDIGKIIYKVSSHQFRVTVANELRQKGVSLQWIQKHMNHLEEEMTKHYFRDEEFVKDVLLSSASQDGSYIEDKSNKQDLQLEEDLEIQKAYSTINKFLKKKKLNVFKNLEEILSIIRDSPINETEIGYCILSFGKICRRKSKLAMLERWYYIKPQNPEISNFDFTYKRLCEKLNTVKHNKKIYFESGEGSKQYELEKKSLEKFYENKFSPELELLKKELLKNKEEVIRKYPNLVEIILKITEIETEVIEWMRTQK